MTMHHPTTPAPHPAEVHHPAPGVRTPAVADGLGLPASAGALIFDARGNLLILDPTYKKGWTIPGGVIEPDGETPWQACRREVFEECALVVDTGRLVAVDVRPAKRGRPAQLRFLFDCGVLPDDVLDGLTVQSEEILAFRLLPPDQALELLRPAVRRRVSAVLDLHGAADPHPGGACHYLEDGHRVPGVG